MTKRIILAMMLMGVFASCSNEQIDRELIVADIDNLSKVTLYVDSVVVGEHLLTSIAANAYVDGPFITSKTATHPILTSPSYGGYCTLTCTVTYQYYIVYPYASTSYYYAGGEVLSLQTKFNNYAEGSFYLLWQDNGTRAYYMSSEVNPLLSPQETLYIYFDGSIVGQTEYFGITGNYPKTIGTTVALRIAP